MRIIFYEVDKPPREMVIDNSLKTMQDLVGGFIENYQVNDKVAIVCNEQGLLEDLKMNRFVCDEQGMVITPILGNFFAVGCGEEDYIGLTDEQAKAIMDKSEGKCYPAWIG